MKKVTLTDTEKEWFESINWWALLCIPIILAITIAASEIQWKTWDFNNLQLHLEAIAPSIVLIAAAVYALHFLITRDLLSLLLGVMALMFAAREVHDNAGVPKWLESTIEVSVYIVIVAVVAGIIILRGKILLRLARQRSRSTLLILTFVSYFIAVLIDRRAFKSVIPNEKVIHSGLEEVAETFSHLCLLTTALLGGWYRNKKQCSDSPD